jgi:hypothetical protein
MNSTTLATVTHALIGLALIGAATVLLALHDVSESTAIALYTAAGALVTGSANTLLALKVPTSSTSDAP